MHGSAGVLDVWCVLFGVWNEAGRRRQKNEGPQRSVVILPLKRHVIFLWRQAGAVRGVQSERRACSAMHSSHLKDSSGCGQRVHSSTAYSTHTRHVRPAQQRQDAQQHKNFSFFLTFPEPDRRCRNGVEVHDNDTYQL